MAVRLAAKRLLEEVGLDGVAEQGLYVALRRGNVQTWLPSHGAWPFSPPVLGPHAVLVVLHPEGRDVFLAPGAHDGVHLQLATSTTVLAPSSSRCHLRACTRGLCLLLVVGTR